MSYVVQVEHKQRIVYGIIHEQHKQHIYAKLLIWYTVQARRVHLLVAVVHDDTVEPYPSQEGHCGARKSMETYHIRREIYCQSACKRDEHHCYSTHPRRQHSNEEHEKEWVDISAKINIVEYQHLQQEE
jgi:hypothetical protein